MAGITFAAQLVMTKTYAMRLVLSVLGAAAGCGGETSTCYSPTANLDSAYEDGAVGCPCDDSADDRCLPDATGRRVALVCVDDRWLAVQDGPCARAPQAACYSPTQNLDAAYDQGAEGCACEESEADQCLPDSTGRNVALVCVDGTWAAVEDGPCGV